MTPAQKQTTQYELLSEKKVMEQLERSYQKALEDVKDRLRQLDERTDVENRQAVAYQKAFQQGLQKQLERILGKLHSKTYRTVQEYLQDCYITGHTAVLYELQSDGLRLSLPVPQDKVCQAAVNDTKLVKPLYDSIGEDFAGLKKHITDIVSAGFASGASYGDMANQITGKMIGNYATLRGGALGRAKLIVRTEGNRIANAARLEAARTAKQQGADLVKQWDSTMDKKTRPHHVQLDGQVRELDEPFEVDGRKAQAPGKFGIASEDINCRCHAYSRPRWAVRADGDYKYDNQHRALVKVSSESYAAYRAGYVQETAGKPDGTVPVPAGHAVEVTPPATKDNGGTGKTYSPEKISGKSLTSGADSGIIEAEQPMAAKTFEKAAEYAKSKLGLSIEKISDLPVEKVNQINNMIWRIYREVPVIRGSIYEVLLEPTSKIAAASMTWREGAPKLRLKLSKELFSNLSIKELENNIQSLVENGWFSPKNGLYGVFKHEATHFAEYVKTLEKYHYQKETVIKSLDEFELAKQIMHTALVNCGLDENDTVIQNYLGGYACDNPAEFIAEAFSSTNNNVLVNEVKRLLSKKWGL